MVVFHLGGALVVWDPRHFYRKLFRNNETAMEDFPALAAPIIGTGFRTPAVGPPQWRCGTQFALLAKSIIAGAMMSSMQTWWRFAGRLVDRRVRHRPNA
jgi:hypothetical protein